MEPSDLLTIGELAARVGVATSALRYYESLGLISSERTPGNQRRYRRATIRRVSVIKAARELGIPLATVAEAFEGLPDDRAPSAEDWVVLAEGWRAELDRRIESLVRLRDALDGCIGCGCLSLEVCILVNPEDRVAAEGPGPRFLLPER
ncbi:MAG TPA: redox-sensitive transcriptional activator SoxR [Actinobacteria bacterium]|nr:redox-sensitive transcriptional activator SoxR [Actinomycetota bacterium]